VRHAPVRKEPWIFFPAPVTLSDMHGKGMSLSKRSSKVKPKQNFEYSIQHWTGLRDELGAGVDCEHGGRAGGGQRDLGV
jgi:hypothetical protein